MDKHELQEKAIYYMDRITAEEEALSLPGLTKQSRNEVSFLYEVDCKELEKIIAELDNR